MIAAIEEYAQVVDTRQAQIKIKIAPRGPEHRPHLPLLAYKTGRNTVGSHRLVANQTSTTRLIPLLADLLKLTPQVRDLNPFALMNQASDLPRLTRAPTTLILGRGHAPLANRRTSHDVASHIFFYNNLYAKSRHTSVGKRP
jgi:hypothetical protein